MKQLRKRFLAVIVCFAMIVSVLSHGVPVYAAEAEYQIYPIPHEMTYQEGNYDILSDVNVVYESGIDDVTKDRMEEILETKDTTVTVSGAVQNGKTNILVGIYGSDEYVDAYVDDNYSIESDVFNEYSGHYVISDEGEIIVLGVDTDAAFYGITSLKHIFNQMDGMNIRNFTIKDYADTSIRGFIEGYYGIPWSNEDRMSLMEFGGDFKMTSYVFAPKDDPYHTSKWRDLYPQDEIDAIAEMVELGNSVKCRFVWTAHPFMGGFNSYDVNGEIESLLNKFEQLYSVGVRQFGVLGDDVGSLNKNIVVQVMTAVSEWAAEKGDVYDSVFCPAGYNHQMQDYSYYELNTYDANFPDDINIFWTGEAVCKPITQATLEHFRRYNATGGERRAPLFWLNWPVNDINGERLMMGKGSLLETTITVDDLAGVVTNPMQEAEASKVAIFAVADYSWNVKAFDDDKSWADSFAYIDADASEELHTLAKHMSNPQPNGHGLVLAESEELQPLINEFKAKLAAGESILETGAQLAAEMDVIIDACDGFHVKSKNENLKDELLPFTGSLKDLAAAIKNYTLAAMELEEGDKTAAFEYFVPGSEAMTNSENHIRYSINSYDMVSPGSTHLIPLAETLEEAIADEILSYVFGETDGAVKLKASSNMEAFYEGSVDNIIDGDTSTHAWYGETSQVGLYYQVSLSEPSTVYGIDILNGSAATGKGQDTFQSAKLQYTTDGTTWLDVPNGATTSSYQESLTVDDLKLENVVAVRYICTVAGGKWPSMREFKVKLTDVEDGAGAVPEFTCEVIRTTDGWSIYEGTDSNAIDGSDSSYVWYRVREGGMIVDDYIGVKLSQPIKLGNIHIAQGTDNDSSDYMRKAKLQYSMDGQEWIDIQNVTTSTIDVDLTYRNITAQYVRLVKTEESQNNWYAIREFKVSARGDYNGICYTNAEDYKGVKSDLGLDRHELQPVTDVTLAPGEYIGLKLDRIHELKSIDLDVSDAGLAIQVSANSVEWITLTEDMTEADARYIRLLNETDANITFDINEFVVSTVEVEGKAVEDTNYTSIGGDIAQLFDNDWTTSVQFANSQNAGKYVVIDLGSEIILNTFKAVCTDTEWDFVRHGKFSVSTNGQDWTEIMTIGSQDSANPGEADDTDNINEVLPDHEISYNTKSVSDLEVPTRYLKFEVTRTKEGTDRWVRFQELEINGGAFIPTINDPTVEGGEQAADNQYGYMMDKNLFSAYTWTGDVLYHESEEEAFNTVKIVQSGISNAAVSVRLAGTDKYVNVGKLSETIKEFTVDGEILDVKISANTETPCSVTEILFATKSAEDIVPEETDKSVLEETIAATAALEEDDYTAESWAVLENALAEAVEVADDEDATGAEITAATNKLLAAIEDLEESIDPEVSTDPTDDSKDVPVDQYTATAGSTQTDNSPDRAIDGNTSSFWEVVWDIGGTNPEKLWYQIELDEVTEVDAVRYYPRWGSNEGDQNGFIEAYRIEVSLDGESYETAAEGTWERTAGWKLALFDETVHAKYVRLVATSTYSDVDDIKGENSNLSIAEIRVREASAATVVKKAALKVAIALAGTKAEADYTAESWAELKTALAAAESVHDDADATQEEVDAATAALNAAIDLLEEKGEEPVIPQPPAEDEDEVVRISGSDRYETGYKAAETLKETLGVEKFDAVVVATGKNFADALSGSYLAIVKKAPILLTNGKDDNVADLHAYIKENVNANGTVYILGGSAAVPETVEAIEGYTVKRLAGSTRYETNLDILAEAGITGTELIVATGKEFADSLSASATGRPILLVKPGAALSAEQKAIAETVKGGNIYVVGGTGAVAETTAVELEAYATVERIAGSGRQETSKKIAEKFFADAETVVLANAKNFPDGLCGGPLAAAMGAPLLLTATGNTAIAEGYVQGNALTSGVVLGGTGALSDEAVVDVFGLESAEEIIVR